jgi:hypothetical protein
MKKTYRLLLLLGVILLANTVEGEDVGDVGDTYVTNYLCYFNQDTWDRKDCKQEWDGSEE